MARCPSFASVFYIACNKSDGIDRLFTQTAIRVGSCAVRAYRDLRQLTVTPRPYECMHSRGASTDEKIIAYLIRQPFYVLAHRR